MRRLALIIMVLAWLFQGMMPALALPMPSAVHAGMGEAMAHHHAPATAAASHHAPLEVRVHAPCADCPDHTSKPACAMSLCAACTALAPHILHQGASAPVFRYPAPGLMAALVAGGPAPLLPPPRA